MRLRSKAVCSITDLTNNRTEFPNRKSSLISKKVQNAFFALGSAVLFSSCATTYTRPLDYFVNSDILHESDKHCSHDSGNIDECRLEELGRIADRPSTSLEHLNNIFSAFENILNNQSNEINSQGTSIIFTLQKLIKSSNPESRKMSIALLGKSIDSQSNDVRHMALARLLMDATQDEVLLGIEREIIGFSRLRYPHLFSDDLIYKILEKSLSERIESPRVYHEYARRLAFSLATDSSRNPKFREKMIDFIAKAITVDHLGYGHDSIHMLEYIFVNKVTEPWLKVKIAKILGGERYYINHMGILISEPSVNDETIVESIKATFPSFIDPVFREKSIAINKLKTIALRKDSSQHIKEKAVELLIDFFRYSPNDQSTMDALKDVAISEWTEKRLIYKITGLFENRVKMGEADIALGVLSQIAAHHSTEVELRFRIVNKFEEYFKSSNKSNLYYPIYSITVIAESKATDPQLRRNIIRILGEIMNSDSSNIAASAISRIAQNEGTDRDLRQTIIQMLKKRISERNNTITTTFQLCHSLMGIYKSTTTDPESKKEIFVWGRGLPPRIRYCWRVVRNL